MGLSQERKRGSGILLVCVRGACGGIAGIGLESDDGGDELFKWRRCGEEERGNILYTGKVLDTAALMVTPKCV